jgi:thiamine-phosphate pyrophosphorylase
MKNKQDWSVYLVTDRALCRGRALEDVVAAAVRGGVTMVQLREKECSTRAFIALAERVLAVTRPRHVPLIINDRVDVALAVDAEGVHVGQDDMPPDVVRRLLARDKILGLSVETMEQAREARAFDVDYLGVSPVFLTPTKAELEHAWGVEGLNAVRAMTSLPLVGIGGIHAGNASRVLRAGADGVAVVSAICSADDPEAAARELAGISKTCRAAAKVST